MAHPSTLPLASSSGVATELWLPQLALAVWSVFIVSEQACSHVVIMCSGVTALSSAEYFSVHGCYTPRGSWNASCPLALPPRDLISAGYADSTPHCLQRCTPVEVFFYLFLVHGSHNTVVNREEKVRRCFHMCKHLLEVSTDLIQICMVQLTTSFSEEISSGVLLSFKAIMFAGQETSVYYPKQR